jgi:hypothetical protein
MGCSLATHLTSIGSSNTSTGTGGKMSRFGHHGDVVVDNVAPRAKDNAKNAHVGLVETTPEPGRVAGVGAFAAGSSEMNRTATNR